LAPALDAQFDAFYQHVFAGAAVNVEAFDASALAYFDARHDAPASLDAYFNNFTPYWYRLITDGRFRDAATMWNWALRPALAWEQSRAARLHKGSPFYFAAMARILGGDLDAGYLAAHRALQEDRETHGALKPATPSLALVAMDADHVEQAFKDWVVGKASLVEQHLGGYRKRHGKILTMRELQERFLKDAALLPATFQFSYAVARLVRIRDLGVDATASEFGAQLQAQVLFSVALVIDTLLKVHHPEDSLPMQVAHLSARLGLRLSQAELGVQAGLFRRNPNEVLQGLVGGSHQSSAGELFGGLEVALLVSYGVRNHGAHSVQPLPVLVSQAEPVLLALLDSLFVVVETLFVE